MFTINDKFKSDLELLLWREIDDETKKKLEELIQKEETRQGNCDLPLELRLSISERAEEKYCRCTDDIEIDSDAKYSPGEDGCWIGAWLWVPEIEEEGV